jgi:ELWxxDGT repeat protein
MTFPRRDFANARSTARFTPLRAEQLEPRIQPAVGPPLSLDADPVSLGFDGSAVAALGDVGYFACGDFAPTFELCGSDGTLGGTSVVSSDGLSPREFVNVNGTLFFVTRDFHLWKTDGTTAGTSLVKDIEVNAGNVNRLTNVNGTLFFSANDGTNGSELWKSDGTPAGTVMVKDIRPGPDQSYPLQLVNVAGTLFFTANDGTHGFELWRSDGTALGTRLIKDIAPGSAHSSPGDLTNLNGTLVFRPNDGVHGYQLWKSDGTESGTVVLKGDFFYGPNTMEGGPRSLYNLNGTLFFTANDGTHGYELWRTDGTAAGTTLVKDIVGGPAASNPGDFTKVGTSLFFYAFDGANYGLWKTHGTDATTLLVTTLAPSSSNRYPRPGVAVAGQLFFPFNDGVNGYELWKSDGTAAGTVLVKDLTPGADGSYPQYLSSVGQTLFFEVTRDLDTRELFALKVVPVSKAGGIPLPAGVRRNGDNLEIGGTEQGDNIIIRPSRGKIIVDGFLGQQVMHLAYSRAAINRITVNLGDGDDNLKISRDIRARGLIDAGAGNDVVIAGGGSVLVVGGDGDDTLIGGNRRDVLIGGEGADKLYGGGESDLLIACVTAYDNNQQALLAVRMEWSSARSQGSRIANLKNATGPILHGPAVRLVNGDSIFNDSDADYLFGGAGTDWFFSDKVIDKTND